MIVKLITYTIRSFCQLQDMTNGRFMRIYGIFCRYVSVGISSDRYGSGRIQDDTLDGIRFTFVPLAPHRHPPAFSRSAKRSRSSTRNRDLPRPILQ